MVQTMDPAKFDTDCGQLICYYFPQDAYCISGEGSDTGQKRLGNGGGEAIPQGTVRTRRQSACNGKAYNDAGGRPAATEAGAHGKIHCNPCQRHCT